MRKLFFGFLAFLLLSFTASDTEWLSNTKDVVVSNAHLKSKIVKYGDTLKLNGHALKERVFVDLYVVSLYLKNKSKNPKYLINSNHNQTIRVNLVSSLVTAQMFEQQFMQQLKKKEHSELLKHPQKLKRFFGSFKGGLKMGDQIDFSYSPQNGFQVFVNHQLKTTIKGLHFKKMISGIWLGDNPFDQDLKNGMLGIASK